MKIASKIKTYSILSWVLIGLTLLLAIIDQIRSGVFNILGFITEILIQPYFWIALILRWRMKVNRKSKNEPKKTDSCLSGNIDKKNKIKKIIAREGLILIGVVLFGLFIKWLAESRMLYVTSEWHGYEVLEPKCDINWIRSLGRLILFFGYPIYLLIRFIIWALRTSTGN